MTTISQLVRRKAEDDRTGLLFEDWRWSWAQVVQAAAERAALITERRGGSDQFHIGVMLDNVPEFPMWLMAAALTGTVVVGINPTRRGSDLARDIVHTECRMIVTETAHRDLLAGLDVAVPPDEVLDVDSVAYRKVLGRFTGAEVPPEQDAAGGREVSGATLYLLLFTSGTSGAPKACLCSQGRLAAIGDTVARLYDLGPQDVCYQAMPMFHSNALMAGWAPALAGGSASALRRRFSASGFIGDVRHFGVTYFNYVGKPLSYILATPELPDDSHNPLRNVFGNEGAAVDVERFATRFGCTVTDSYGSTEGGVSVTRGPDTPPAALGAAREGTVVLDPETGREMAVATFDGSGRLTNPDEAIGELANRLGRGSFEGYWKNDAAQAARVHDGTYWTGDLAYRDEQGYIYFAGRSYEWMRVDGENLAAAQIEVILGRHPDVVLAAVYGVPDPVVGDQVMAALQLRAGSAFDPAAFARFLGEQGDLGTKASPRFVRVAPVLPVTSTHKVLKRELRRDAWDCSDPVWWRPERDAAYALMTEADVAGLRERFAARGRMSVLETG